MSRAARLKSALLLSVISISAVAVAAIMPSAGADELLPDPPLTSTTLVQPADAVAQDLAETVEEETGVTTSSSSPSTSSSTTSSTTSTTSSSTTTTLVPVSSVPQPSSGQPQRNAPGGKPQGQVKAVEVAPATGALEGLPPALDAGAAPSPLVLAAERAGSPPAVPIAGGPRSTADIVDSLGLLQARPELICQILAPFPVCGPASYSNDWGAPRHGHLHEGTDIFALRGTPVIASSAGVITRMSDTDLLGGTALTLTTADRTYFYYAHLDGFAPGLQQGDAVELGDVLGFAGNTGNAAGTAYHLHYEIHPLGGDPVPPVEYLDQWLADARVRLDAIKGTDPVTAAALVTGMPRPSPVIAPADGSGPAGAVRPAGSIKGIPAAAHPLLLMLLTVPVWLFASRRHQWIKWHLRRLKAVARR